MHPFQNILVGVDLTKCRQLDLRELDPPTWEAITHGIWLAQQAGSRLLFFAALNLTEEAFHHLEEEQRTHLWSTVEDRAGKLLAELVRRAEQTGVKARSMLVLGKGWLEIIRQVLRGRHDLVVIGTSQRSGLRRMLFGNTGLKLLRRCPCPVLVTKPGHGSRKLNVLVATALQPVSVQSLRIGISLGRLVGGTVHALHVLEYPLDYLWGTAYPDRDTREYHHRLRAAAEEKLDRLLDEADEEGHGAGVRRHLLEGVGVPDVAIQHFIEVHKIDLLVMGTIARGGLQGFMIGNTAERLLPEVQCSLLAVKPPDFHSPVQLDENE